MIENEMDEEFDATMEEEPETTTTGSKVPRSNSQKKRNRKIRKIRNRRNKRTF